MSDNKESAKSTRQKAAEARATAQAAERRRERMIRIVGGLAVLVVVVGKTIASRQAPVAAQDVSAPQAGQK